MESAKPKHGSVRMFQSDFLEWFSHVHPVTPVVLFLPLVGFSVYLARVEHHRSIASIAGLFVAGYLLWTLFEYWMHRLFFHLPVRGPWSQRLYAFFHGVHHDYPWDTTRLVMPPAVSLSLAALTYGLFRLFLGDDLWAPYAGFVFGYVTYDTAHWYAHVGKPRNRFGRWLRREHLIHHFKEPTSRFGVSCPWLDHVFGTTGERRETDGVGERA